MEKPAVTALDIHPLIRKRWSPRSFDPDRAVGPEKIGRFLEAARWAPSGFNEQPWRFILGIKGERTWEGIYSTLVEFNQKWAHNAAVLVMTLGKKSLTKNGKENSSFRYDAGGSVGYMTLQAVSEGLITHQMGGFSKENARELFNIPDDFEPLTVMAIGYQDLPDRLEDDDMRDSEVAPRLRRPLAELLYESDMNIL